jgi:Family of unknown function (DUF6152)
MKGRAIAVLVLAALIVGGRALAHHSFAAEFDANRPVQLKGIVTKIEWTNPHVWVYLNVKDDESGDVVNWGAELGPPHLLQRRGWRRTTLQIGTQITVDGYLARTDTPRMNARSITLTATGGAPGETLDTGSSQLQGDGD